MPARKRQNVAVIETLPAAVPKIFENVQNHKATHQKNFVALHKLLLESSAVTRELPDGSLAASGEALFMDVFRDMLNRIVTVKKGTQVADRVVQFVSGFVGYITSQSCM